MNIQTLSASLKLPELKIQKFLITEPDDKGFAKDQYDKIMNRIQTQKQLQLKPWEKELDNIYSSSGRSNHQIFQNIKTKVNSKTIDLDEISYNNEFYKKEQLNTINDSVKISNQIKLNAYIKKKIKLPISSLKKYILETKQICKNKLISDIVKNERNIIHRKQSEYDRALKQEIKNLNKDIMKFELYSTNEMFERNQKFKYINNMENKKKSLLEEIKDLSQEYHSLKANIQKLLRYINEKKIYVNFVNKLLGGESKMANINYDGINIQKIEDNELHSLVNKIKNQIQKNNLDENIFVSATDEELMENINKIDIIFKIMEEKILKTLYNKEKIRQELIEFEKNQKIVLAELKSRIEETEKEYENIMKEFNEEKDNANLKSHSPEDYNFFIRTLLIDFFSYLDQDFVKSKDDVDEYNIIDKVVKPAIDNIKYTENQIDDLLSTMEKYSEEDPELFNKCLNKIKNENKLKKYYRERENRDMQIKLKNNKIMEKFNKVFVKERNKFKMLAPLSIFRKPKSIVKHLKTESADFKLIIKILVKYHFYLNYLSLIICQLNIDKLLIHFFFHYF